MPTLILVFLICFYFLQVETHSFRLATERSTAQGDFRRRMGQLQYLENLQRDDLGHKGGLNPEICPICRKALGEKVCAIVLQVILFNYTNV
jgi:hypothetical protein